MDIKEKMIPKKQGYCFSSVDACQDLVISMGVCSGKIYEFFCVRKTEECVKRGECPIRAPEENLFPDD
ncbi:MAG: hypothetical protein PHQ81_03310 [Methanofollis sp.]|nr:hypothetical protein [Methanofollis sp.]